MKYVCPKRDLFNYVIALMIIITIITPGEVFALRPLAHVLSQADKLSVEVKASSAGKIELSRRDFLKGLGALTIGTALSGVRSLEPTLTGAADLLQASDLPPDFLKTVMAGVNTYFKGFIDLNSTTLTDPYYEEPGFTLPKSFWVALEDEAEVYGQMADWAERRFIANGTVFYDAALASMYKDIYHPPTEWPEGRGTDLAEIIARRHWGQMSLWSDNIDNFPLADLAVLIFRATDGTGRWMVYDPKTGELMPWPDWLPGAGENAWVALSLAHSHFRKYGREAVDSIELNMAKLIADNLKQMIADNGGIRHALPSRDDYSLWKTMSTENNISAYAAFRALYEITGDEEYRDVMNSIERYLSSVAKHNEDTGEYYFAIGAHEDSSGTWIVDDEPFATDCQTWAILTLGPEKINEIFFNEFGNPIIPSDSPRIPPQVGTPDEYSYLIWNTTTGRTGQFKDGRLAGLAYYDKILETGQKQEVISPEFTAGGIEVALILRQFYEGKEEYAVHEAQLADDALSMREYIERFRTSPEGSTIAYSHASNRGSSNYRNLTLPKEVMSMASTMWLAFLNNGFNPFYLESETIPLAMEISLLAMLREAERRRNEPEVPEGPEEVVIADRPDTTSTQWASSWVDGPFNIRLSQYDTLRVEFDLNQQGVAIQASAKFVVKIRPPGVGDNSSVGLNTKIYTIPEDGIVEIPISEFPLSDSQLDAAVQISIHSGSNPYGRVDLGQSQNVVVEFKRIIAVRSEAAGNTSVGPAVEPEIDVDIEFLLLPMVPEEVIGAICLFLGPKPAASSAGTKDFSFARPTRPVKRRVLLLVASSA